MGRAYVVVEGQGEQHAVPNLLNRLCIELGQPDVVWASPIRIRRIAQERGLTEACELVRSKPDAQMLMILRDEDDGCAAEDGPRAAEAIQTLDLPFPVAVVLAVREYESLFLASLGSIAGQELEGPGGMPRPGLSEQATFLGDLEGKRDTKGWLSQQMPAGVTYKPTVDQLPMTRLVDFGRVRQSELPWFGTLERALRFLCAHRDQGRGVVYPTPG